MGDIVKPDDNRTVFDCYADESALAIEMRRLWGKLRQKTRGTNAKTLMITSATLGEGKSTVSSFLALTIAKHKRTKTIIVDADLRRPRLHHIFAVPRTVGLSSLLQSSAKVDAAIVPTGIAGFDVLPAGPGSQRSNELLASSTMAELLDELDRRYDMVIIDTPPSGMLSDAAILSKLVEGVLVVVREQTVSRTLVREVVHRLQQVGAPVLGVVVNAVDMTGRASKYKYYYSYRYQYYDEESKPEVAAK